MAGKRMLHRNICESDKLAAVSDGAESLWYRIYVNADDNGNYHRDARLIKSYCLSLRELSGDEVEKRVRELLDVKNGGEHGLLAEYQANGKTYLHIMDFHKFQVLRPDRMGDVRFPEHPEALGPVLRGFRLATTGCGLATDPQPPAGMKLREVEVKRSKEKKAHPAVAPARDFAFQAFERKLGQKPNWVGKDFIQLADLFKRRPELTLPEFSRRWTHYLASTEEFIRKQGFSLAYFCSRFDSFLAGPIREKPGQGPKLSAAQQAREDEKRRNEISPEGRKMLARFN